MVSNQRPPHRESLPGPTPHSQQNLEPPSHSPRPDPGGVESAGHAVCTGTPELRGTDSDHPSVDLGALAAEARACLNAGGELADPVAGRAGVPVGAGRRPGRRTPPAEGERSAIVGYLGQYEFAALRTIEALREGTLVSVRLADVKAGQIDDFQLRLTDRLDAYQVKWSRLPGSIGYAEFVHDSKGRTRYIRQLAEGWERLTAMHRPLRVVVHFVTNDLASNRTSKSISRAANECQSSTTRSFAAFLAEAWRPATEAARAGIDPTTVVPAEWAPAMALFAEASGLKGDVWVRFLADCELEFGVRSLEEILASAPLSDVERAALRRDCNELAHTLMRLVARADRRVEFTREQLLDELGWRRRADFRNKHEFPDPDIPYRSIAATADELRAALERFSQGYIALVGSPGSGKSTLLTRTLRESPHRVVRYYAYVPDAVGGSIRRGEAVNFLHDLAIALDRLGLHAGGTLPVNDLDLLLERVRAQFAQAHREWVESGRRTIILVDGLDHVSREQRPQQSLLAHLPPPDEVPDGVLFVLGTQTERLDDLSPRIREHLNKSGRRIEMSPLSRADVLEIIDETVDLHPKPSPAERERIYQLSGGHPLALSYIINRLRQARGTAVEEVLDAVAPFNETIDEQYAAIWTRVEDDVELARLLALLARARGPVRLDWVRSWGLAQAFHTVTTRLAYLFRREHGNRWAFFHNSFRAFIIEHTRELPALGGDVELFTELAERSAAPGASVFERADELYYRARAGDTARVLSLADPESFRAQFIAGRPAAAILDDLSLAFEAALQSGDIVALTRVLLCNVEFDRREYHAEVLEIWKIWLDLGDVDLALVALRDGATLRTSEEDALRAAAALDARGFRAEAEEIFALAEPLDVLQGVGERAHAPRVDIGLLETWIDVAPRFRAVAEILQMIDNVRVPATSVHWLNTNSEVAWDEAETRGLQYRLLLRLGRALDRLGRWDEADGVRERLAGSDNGLQWWFWAQAGGWHDALRSGEDQRAAMRLSVVCDRFEAGGLTDDILGPAERVALAEGYFLIRRDPDAARRVVQDVEQPPPATDASARVDAGWASFHQRFALNRVLGALGDDRPLHEIVPEVRPATEGWPEIGHKGAKLWTQFERAVAQLGRLAGLAWAGKRLAPSDFEAEARRLVRLFPGAPQYVWGAEPVFRARREFCLRLVDIAADHGWECLAVLQRLLDGEWSDQVRQGAWPHSLIRAILRRLLSRGASSEWVRRWLVEIEPATFSGSSIEDDLSEGIAQVHAWIAVGDRIAARRTLERVLRATFMLHEKDIHLNLCIRWAVLANEEDPAGAPERLGKIAAVVRSLDGTRAQAYAAPELLKAGVAAGPWLARTLVEWVIRNGVCGWVEAMNVLIGGLAERAPAAASTLSACYRSLVLPFARAAHIDAVLELGKALRSIGDTREIATLADAIEVTALGSTRPALRAALAGRAEDARELLRDGSVMDPTAPGYVVDSFEGLSLTLRELQARVRSLEDVQDLVHRLKPDAYGYRLDLILGPFIAGATPDELVAAAEAIPQNDYAWYGLARIAERLLDLGDPRAAVVIERIVQSSRGGGWWPSFDGGSRLAAYELLVRAAPEEGRRRAWTALQRDMATGLVPLIGAFAGWERIVTLLAPEASAVSIWEEVSRHVEALVSDGPQEEAPTLPAGEERGDPAEAATAVCGFVAGYLDHPAIALAHGARQFFTDRVLAGDPAAEAALVERLASPHTLKSGALLVLRAVARVRGEVPPATREVLRSLLNAPNYADRRAAAMLLHVDGESAQKSDVMSPRIRRPLPALFQIVHPSAPPRMRRPLPAWGEMLPPAEDALDLVSMFRDELDLIAMWAGVQPEALYRYVADRATSYLPEGNRRYGYDDEPDVREELIRLGLEIPYRRPRPRRVERAMAEAVAMLLDHGWLDERHVPALDELFVNADPYFLVVRPGRRPPAVAPIPERAKSEYVPDNWTTGVSADSALVGRTTPVQVIAPSEEILPRERRADAAPGVPAARQPVDVDEEWIILAEYTWLRWLHWKEATETRVGARLEPSIWTRLDRKENVDPQDKHDSGGEIAASKALNAHLARLRRVTADEYLTRGRAPYSIIVRNEAYRFDTPGGSWLALNPKLAEHLGWRLAPDGLFRWVDADGNVMAESIWWQDGFPGQRPPLFHDEVGEGWLVRVSLSGWRQIAAVVGQCGDWCRVARLANKQMPTAIEATTPVFDKPAESG